MRSSWVCQLEIAPRRALDLVRLPYRCAADQDVALLRFCLWRQVWGPSRLRFSR